MVIRLALLLLISINVCLLSQIQAQSGEIELTTITQKYDLSTAQRIRVQQLLEARDQAFETIRLNPQFDELQREQKRSSIREGFEYSIILVLNDEQRSIDQTALSQKRKADAAIIERMKKDGYSQSEIKGFLNKHSKVKSINE